MKLEESSNAILTLEYRELEVRNVRDNDYVRNESILTRSSAVLAILMRELSGRSVAETEIWNPDSDSPEIKQVRIDKQLTVETSAASGCLSFRTLQNE